MAFKDDVGVQYMGCGAVGNLSSSNAEVRARGGGDFGRSRLEIRGGMAHGGCSSEVKPLSAMCLTVALYPCRPCKWLMGTQLLVVKHCTDVLMC